MGSGCGRTLILSGLLGTGLLAGPPFFTDDPEPVELHHMEFYLSWVGTRGSGDASGSLPLAEFNLGILPETQLHLVAPVAYAKPAGEAVTRGYGDTEIGLKIRLLREFERIQPWRHPQPVGTESCPGQRRPEPVGRSGDPRLLRLPADAESGEGPAPRVRRAASPAVNGFLLAWGPFLG